MSGDEAAGAAQVRVTRARVGEIAPLAAEYRRDAARHGEVDDDPLPSDAVYWVARDGGDQLLGYAAGTLRQEGLVLGPFYVRPQHRRAGVGRQLLETIQRWADEQEVRLLEVAVSAGNQGGVSFLEALGYRPTRVLMARPVEPR
ncbi:MAG TPA: GNAT family N-acetyltransferase [Egibacteraceae bacterium]